jgi:hypothetical protein
MLFQVTPTVDRGRRLPQHGLVVALLGIITLIIIIVAGEDPQEAVSFAVCVTEVSRDCSRWIDGARPSACAPEAVCWP